MILAIGAAVDLSPHRDPQTAERYHHLARAAVCETAVIDDPSFDTINTLVGLDSPGFTVSLLLTYNSFTKYGTYSCFLITRERRNMRGALWFVKINQGWLSCD